MKPGAHQQTPTLFEAVQRAVTAVDPDGDQHTDEFLLRFEDRDEPITGLQESIEQEVAEAKLPLAGAIRASGTER